MREQRHIIIVNIKGIVRKRRSGKANSPPLPRILRRKSGGKTFTKHRRRIGGGEEKKLTKETFEIFAQKTFCTFPTVPLALATLISPFFSFYYFFRSYITSRRLLRTDHSFQTPHERRGVSTQKERYKSENAMEKKYKGIRKMKGP